MKKHEEEQNQLDPQKFQLGTWPDLQHMAEVGGCKCCGRKFSQDIPMEIASKCHPGYPLWVQYWDGMLYIKCSACESPVIKIEVSRSLLAQSVQPTT